MLVDSHTRPFPDTTIKMSYFNCSKGAIYLNCKVSRFTASKYPLIIASTLHYAEFVRKNFFALPVSEWSQNRYAYFGLSANTPNLRPLLAGSIAYDIGYVINEDKGHNALNVGRNMTVRGIYCANEADAVHMTLLHERHAGSVPGGFFSVMSYWLQNE